MKRNRSLLVPVVVAVVGAVLGATSVAKGAPVAYQTQAPKHHTTTLVGTWSGKYSGAFTGTFTLHWTQTGSALSGSITLSSPSGKYNVTGSVHGTAISFGAVGAGATYTGSVSGTSMSGTYKSPVGGGSWSAQKTNGSPLSSGHLSWRVGPPSATWWPSKRFVRVAFPSLARPCNGRRVRGRVSCPPAGWRRRGMPPSGRANTRRVPSGPRAVLAEGSWQGWLRRRLRVICRQGTFRSCRRVRPSLIRDRTRLSFLIGARNRSPWKRGAGACSVVGSWVGSRVGLRRRKLSGFWPPCSSSAPWSMQRLDTAHPRSSLPCWHSLSTCAPGRAAHVSALPRGRADEVRAAAGLGSFLSSTAPADVRSGPEHPDGAHPPVSPGPTLRNENPRSEGHTAHVVVRRNAISATGWDVEASGGRSARLS